MVLMALWLVPRPFGIVHGRQAMDERGWLFTGGAPFDKLRANGRWPSLVVSLPGLSEAEGSNHERVPAKGRGSE